MCGIAGFKRSFYIENPESLLTAMGNVIAYRGPDASGVFVDDCIGMVHRRLSILDLSPQGNQPMFSADDRYVIVFNGEIYNFQELREDLHQAGTVFRTRTDTEVLLELYSHKGKDFLPSLNGMFAFVIWDKEQRELFIARDRVGKKPLYYYFDGNGHFAFASEIKSLLQLPYVTREVEPTAICDFLKYQYIPSPKTIFKNIYKLPPASSISLTETGDPVVESFWPLEFTPNPGINEESAVEELMELLEDATRLRMVADVPLGAFLSGGVDSSAVVALMAKASSDPVRTCSIGFDDPDEDESVYAAEVAQMFNTTHHEFRVTEDVSKTVALLPRFFDEPFADSSAVPTYHVSQLARKAVTVALAGDGGDENFAGYAKYAVELKEQLVRHSVPKFFLQLINRMCGDSYHPLLKKGRSLTGSALLPPDKAFYISNSHIEDSCLNNVLSSDIRMLTQAYDPSEHISRHWNALANQEHVARMLYTDIKTYLPDDILVKVDRMSMAHSLEVRAPFLDYRIIEFAAALPADFKIKGEQKKVLLKKAFSRLLPEHILQRKKHGFSVPLANWFRADIKPFAESALLETPALASFFDLGYIRKLWSEHQTGLRDHGTVLWSLLMFALWQKEYLPA